MKKINLFIVCFCVLIIPTGALQSQVKIGDNPTMINAASLLELESTARGLLIPRMTTTQRDAIATPPNGLQIYNTTTNKTECYRLTQWESVNFDNPSENLKQVYALSDLPAPSSGGIMLDASKMYVFHGMINISPNYLNLNGAGLRGTDPGKDGVMSSVSGGVLRSTGVSVFIENLAVIPASGGTKAYDFADATGSNFCNLFSGSSVIEIGITSLGVGQISGFKAITIQKNYWKCADGIKITGNVGKFTSSYNFITGISNGSGIEFLSGLTIDDIDLANNYFIYSGQTGVKVNAGAYIDLGRMNTNMFRGVTTLLNGFDSYTPGWEMMMNTSIPNSRAYGYLYFNDNLTSTSTSPNNSYVKIAGTTTVTTLQKFSSPANNRLLYTGKRTILARVLITITGKSPTNGADFTFALAKNGTAITTPKQTTATLINNQSFTLILESEVSLSTNDYIEVFIKTTSSTSSVTISDLQFRAEN